MTSIWSALLQQPWMIQVFSSNIVSYFNYATACGALHTVKKHKRAKCCDMRGIYGYARQEQKSLNGMMGTIDADNCPCV